MINPKNMGLHCPRAQFAAYDIFRFRRITDQIFLNNRLM